MGDTLITIIVIVLSAILIFVFPVLSMADRIDTASQTDVETITSDFVNQIRSTGKLTKDEYDVFLGKLTSTGNTYNIDLEFRIMDENARKKALQSALDKIGENVYYSVYTTQIEKILETEGVYKLKEGDMVFTTVKNTNLTFSQQMKNIFYLMSGNNVYTIQASQAGLVTATGN